MKKFIVRWVACLLSAQLLVACGGGSGASGSTGTPGAETPARNPAGDWLTLSPSPVEVTTYEGESKGFIVLAKSTKTFSKPFNAAIVDKVGVISPTVHIAADSAMEYRAYMVTSQLAAGVHTSNIELRLCEDDPLICRLPLAGSPWTLPVKVTVKSKAEGAARLSVSPALNLSAYVGEPISFTVSTKPLVQIARELFIAVVDPAGYVTPEKPFEVYSSVEERKTPMKTSASLAPGTYTTIVEVRICMDAPVNCKQPIAGSPWLVPLTLTIKPATNFTALTTLPQLGAWSTYKGNAAHSGYVAASFNPVNFNRRWKAAGGTYTHKLFGVAIDNGVIFNANGFNYQKPKVLEAIREDTGELLWKVDMGLLSHVNPPAAANGKVYVTTTGHADSFQWVYDQKTGALLNKTATSSQWQNYMAPTVVANDVYSLNGGVGGMSKFNGLTNKMTWAVRLPQYDSYTPSVDANHAYAYADGALHALSLDTGAVAYTVADPEHSFSGYDGRTVVLSGSQMGYVVEGRRLVGFDLASRTRAWSLKLEASSQPVVAKNVVYVLATSGTLLHALDAAKGTPLWTSEPLGFAHYNEVIVTDNLAFVSSGAITKAIDLQTHKTVWEYPFGGSLAISDRGVLYIFNATGAMAAINLQ